MTPKTTILNTLQPSDQGESSSLPSSSTPASSSQHRRGNNNPTFLTCRRFSWQRAFRLHNLALAGLVLMLLYAVVMPFFATADLHEADLAAARLAPSATHWFGTDLAGHDLLVRVALGLRVSLIVAAVCALVSTVIGVLVGAIAASWGGKLDAFLMRLTDTVNALPQLLLGIAIVAFYPGSLTAIIASIALVHWCPVARIVRSIALSTRELEYVEAAYLAGANRWQVARKHLLPSVFGQMKVSVVLLFPHAIWHESTLSFLGLGISPDRPSLGTLLEVARTEILLGCWWELVFPAGALVLLTLLIFGWASGLGQPSRGKSRLGKSTGNTPTGDLETALAAPSVHEVPSINTDEAENTPALEFQNLSVTIPRHSQSFNQQTHELPPPERPTASATEETPELAKHSSANAPLILEHLVNLRVMPGELHVLLGQSGAGKSLLAKAATGMLPRRMQLSGQIRVAGVELYGKNCPWQRVRGRLVAVAAQSSATAFAPNRTIGAQLAEAVQVLGGAISSRSAPPVHEEPAGAPRGGQPTGLPQHTDEKPLSVLDSAGRADAGRDKTPAAVVAELCEMTGFPADSLDAYPHELSGGMLTRAGLALALAGRPAVLIADEVTAGLDQSRRDQIWRLLRGLADRGIAVLAITHDLAMLLDLPLADTMTVLGAGRVLEQGAATQVLDAPRHAYTRKLLAALPRNLARIEGAGDNDSREARIGEHTSASGMAPHEAEVTSTNAAVTGKAPHELGDKRNRAGVAVSPADDVASHSPGDAESETVLEVENLAAGYHGVPVVQGFNLQLHRGETVGWYGDSGCGKTTTARAIAGRIQPLVGRVKLAGFDASGASGASGVVSGTNRRETNTGEKHPGHNPESGVAMLFQSPRRSVNPRWTLGQIMTEPLVYAGMTADMQREKCAEICSELGIPSDFLRRFPAEVSEGQLQRIALARCLLTEPRVLICDEATAMLDAFSTASLVRAIRRRSARGLAVIAISHDRELLDYWADRSLSLG